MRSGVLALLGVFACNGGGSSEVVNPGPGTGTATGTDYVPAEVGLDQRPENLSCLAPDRPLTDAQVQFARAYSGVSFNDPIWIGQHPDVPGYWYVAEQTGRILRFQDDPAVSSTEVVLDLQSRADDATSEQGLLGMAFAPDFGTSGRLYVYYTASNDASRLARYTSSDGGASFDFGSEEILIEFDQPFWNHNGGALAFGPDGYLYWGMGDGGSGGDPGNRAQNTDEWLGKILRIDVSGASGYTVPADNPFAAGGGRAEIYAYGIRNPWRFTFDDQDGTLWVGDVGQNDWEEISKVELGGNYGWRIMEGDECYEPPSGCDKSGLVRPYVTYPNNFGASVVAGVVYYGSEIPELNGTLLYIDYYAGDLMGLGYDAVTGLPEARTLANNTGRTLPHFATGLDGEVVVVDYSNGNVYRLERSGAGQTDPFPAWLSETGCVDPSDPSQPSAAMVPYGMNHPFWSDGADKERWMAIPDGTRIEVDEEGDWIFPVGSVLLKHFRVGGALVESRLMVRHDDGDWAGYTYAWEGGDAALLTGGLLVDTGDVTWTVPDRSQCLQCHTQAAGGSLGLETAQLNGDFGYPSTGRLANQVATLAHIGMLETSLGNPANLPALPALDDASASVEDRSRAWLHTNCSSCHRPGGPSRGDIDFRYDTPLADMNACDVQPLHGDLELGNAARVINPGKPNKSVLISRMARRDAYQMPPMGSLQVDDAAVDVLTEWVTGLTCP